MNKESSAERTFASWKRKYPDKFPAGRELSSYVKLDEETGEPICTIKKNRVAGSRWEPCGEETIIIAPNLEYKHILFRTTLLCPTCLAFGLSGEITEETVVTKEMNTGRLTYFRGGPIIDDVPPPTLFQANMIICPLRQMG